MTFRPNATVVADGAEYPCRAKLNTTQDRVSVGRGQTVDGLKSRSGVLEFKDTDTMLIVGMARELRLRIGNDVFTIIQGQSAGRTMPFTVAGE